MIIQVTCAIILQNNRFLAAKRSQSMPHSGFWEFPGGKIEGGESAEDCLIREIKEELSCKISLIKELPVFAHQFKDKHIELIPFLCNITNGIPVPIEHEEIRWLNQSELNTVKWLPADMAIIEFLESFNSKSFY